MLEDSPSAGSSRQSGRRRTSLAVALAFSAGMLFSLQLFLLGRLGTSVGSAELAATINNFVAGAVLIGVALSTRAAGRALGRMRAGARVRWWQLLMGANGGFLIIVAGTVAPKVGVALLTVALVSGQTLAGLVVDRLGLSPAGARRFTAPRVIGAGLALIAVGLTASGQHQDLHVGWIGLAVLAGAGAAVQQAAIGHVVRSTGEPLVAGVLNIAVGGIVVLTAWLLATGGTAPDGWSAPIEELVAPGVCAAVAVVVVARIIAKLGVLRLGLALIAGQSVAALAIDGIAASPGEAVTLGTFASVIITLVAVVVSGLNPAAAQAPRTAG